MRDDIIELKIHDDSFVRDIARRFEDIYLYKDRTGFKSLMVTLGKFGLRYLNADIKEDKKFLLAFNIVFGNFYKIVKSLDKDYEYIITAGVGEYAIVYNTLIPVLNIEPYTTTLFRISNKNYSPENPTSDAAFDFAKSFAYTSARHVDNATQRKHKTNSYSKSLGVCLFKYLGQATKIDGKKTFTLKIIENAKINTLQTVDGETFNIRDISNYKESVVNNMILDASEYAGDYKEYYWGAVASNKRISPPISPSGDKEVLVYNDRELARDFILTINDAVHLNLEYYCTIIGWDKSMVDAVYIKLLERLKKDYRSIPLRIQVEELISYINDSYDKEKVRDILSMISKEGDSATYEDSSYIEKEAWGATKLDGCLDILRIIQAAIKSTKMSDDADVNIDRSVNKFWEIKHDRANK